MRNYRPHLSIYKWPVYSLAANRDTTLGYKYNTYTSLIYSFVEFDKPGNAPDGNY